MFLFLFFLFFFLVHGGGRVQIDVSDDGAVWKTVSVPVPESQKGGKLSRVTRIWAERQERLASDRDYLFKKKPTTTTKKKQ